MHFKKFLSTVIATVCLCAGSGISAYAENSVQGLSSIGGISPAYEITQGVDSSLSINGTNATCMSRANNNNCASISVTHTLQKYSGWFWIWNDVDNASWSKTVNVNTICLISTKNELSSGTYRVKSVFMLTDKQGKTETITVYSDEKKT